MRRREVNEDKRNTLVNTALIENLARISVWEGVNVLLCDMLRNKHDNMHSIINIDDILGYMISES